MYLIKKCTPKLVVKGIDISNKAVNPQLLAAGTSHEQNKSNSHVACLLKLKGSAAICDSYEEPAIK